MRIVRKIGIRAARGIVVSEAQKRARAKYSKENMVQRVVRFSPNERDLLEYLDAQPNRMGFIKSLIRTDMKGRTVKTVSEILANWETERDNDWYAIDEITTDGRTLRLFVGDADTTKRKAADLVTGVNLVDYEGNPCEPGEFGDQPYYRCQLIDSSEAKAYLEKCMA